MCNKSNVSFSATEVAKSEEVATPAPAEASKSEPPAEPSAPAVESPAVPAEEVKQETTETPAESKGDVSAPGNYLFLLL